jgi:hypothetical protein
MAKQVTPSRLGEKKSVLSNNTFAGDRSEEGRAHIAQDSRPILTLCTPRLEQFVPGDTKVGIQTLHSKHHLTL